jgi:hypothetical protein
VATLPCGPNCISCLATEDNGKSTINRLLSEHGCHLRIGTIQTLSWDDGVLSQGSTRDAATTTLDGRRGGGRGGGGGCRSCRRLTFCRSESLIGKVLGDRGRKARFGLAELTESRRLP